MTIDRRTPTRTDNSGDFMTERMSVNGGSEREMFLDEVLFALKQAGSTDVYVHSAFLSWVRPATENEKQQHRDYTQRRVERAEQWERDTLARLKEKYDVPHPDEEPTA